MAVCEGLCEYLVKDKYNVFCPATPLRHDPKEYDITAGNVDRYSIDMSGFNRGKSCIR